MATALEAKREEMIKQVEEYRTQVTDAFDEILASLRKGEYAGACSIMSTLSKHQAQASVNMRTVLIRHGFIAREKDSD